jgi:hypothetical protein
MTTGGQTPDELETLLEDALLLRDADAVARLFHHGGVLVTGSQVLRARGHSQIRHAAPLLWQYQPNYLAAPRDIHQTRDTALLLGEGVINVARRSYDGTWRYVIAVLERQKPSPRVIVEH